MIKDQLFKRIFIPLSGIAFPFLAGLLRGANYSLLQVGITILFFVGITALGWQGLVKVTAYLHAAKRLQPLLFYRLFLLVMAGAAVGSAVFGLSGFLWQKFFLQASGDDAFWNAALVGLLYGIMLASLYEVIFLSVERRLDDRVLQQLDKERQEAELTVLKNELDPHFFFNCMNTLSYLVREDGQKAYQFVHKLSSVYKYFLLNKEKVVVPLKDELEFLSNYVYLLRIRFDNNIRVDQPIGEQDTPFYILPCSLHVLVENAIKHNSFSEAEPLEIAIAMNGRYLTVANPVKAGLQVAESTKVGLRNLKARYHMVSNQAIVVQKTDNRLVVKLPVITKNNQHD